MHLVTGATGLLGSHIAERLVQRGDRVRALVRPASNTRFLEALGVELAPGDLDDADSCRRACEGADAVFHSAAKVGDWGTWPEFQSGCIDATRHVAEAALGAGARRLVHISSTSAYGHPADRDEPIDESHPLGENIWRQDHYTRAKVECERMLWGLAERRSLSLTIIRPSWLYGERDRITFPRLVGQLRAGRMKLVGPGDNPMSAIHAGCVADAAILAADDPGSAGEAYNVTDQGPITQRDFFDLLAGASGASPVRATVPFRLAFAGGSLLESWGRLTRRKQPPFVTRYAAWLLGRRLSYSTAKARGRLGWAPALTYAEAIRRAIDWHQGRGFAFGDG
jgi:nucleoside-diphosphate-sugar epimerase